MAKDTKDNLLRASHKLFMKKGYEETKVEDICLEVGTAKGSFFYYFDKKENVVAYLLVEQLGRMEAGLRDGLNKLGSPNQKMSMLMSILLLSPTEGPESMAYFRNGIPTWYEAMSHTMRDDIILPVIKEIVAEGIVTGDYDPKCSDIAVEVVYIGIAETVHRNLSVLTDPELSGDFIGHITYVLNQILGTNNIIIDPGWLQTAPDVKPKA